jgi:hypothetical protein
MIGDNLKARSYSSIMAEEPAHIILRLEYKDPIELGDFVSTFTSIGNQFERFIRSRYPDLKTGSEVFVKEIRPGSIEVDFIPYVGSIMALMEHAVVIEEFVRIYGERIGRYFNLGGRVKEASKSDLKDFMGAVEAVARDPQASSAIEAAYFEDGKKKIRAAFHFSTSAARKAVDEIEQHRREIEHGASSDYPRVLMVFSQSNIKDSALGKRTGERVIIEEISDRELPLVYASDLAEERIKHEIREADENVYKKGFIVDVNVQLRGGRPVAYRVTNLHQVIDLPDD